MYPSNTPMVYDEPVMPKLGEDAEPRLLVELKMRWKQTGHSGTERLNWTRLGYFSAIPARVKMIQYGCKKRGTFAISTHAVLSLQHRWKHVAEGNSLFWFRSQLGSVQVKRGRDATLRLALVQLGGSEVVSGWRLTQVGFSNSWTSAASPRDALLPSGASIVKIPH